MRYLNEEDILTIGINWDEAIDVIENVVRCLDKGDFAQPIKPYLRYRNQKNRIIAMPAFVGGNFNVAGIKWIASFPENISKGLSRAHSVIVLNNADTGEIISVINTALLSIIRTVSVSGLLMRYYDKARNLKKFNLGIVGFGPIGKKHLEFFLNMYGERISKVFLYDINPIIKNDAIECSDKNKIIITDTWDEAYHNSDVFVACTVANKRYINKKPKDGSLQLNVSLRDYKSEIFEYVKNAIIVDNWDEVCRENTDIELMSKEKGLNKNMVKTLTDIVCLNYMDTISKKQSIMFNPMGMGVFDIAISKYYFDKAEKKKIGMFLI